MSFRCLIVVFSGSCLVVSNIAITLFQKRWLVAFLWYVACVLSVMVCLLLLLVLLGVYDMCAYMYAICFIVVPSLLFILTTVRFYIVSC